SEGEACNPSEPRTCVTGLHCDVSTTRCATPLVEGTTCNGPDRDLACRATAYCDRPEGGDEGTCTAKKPARALCSASIECQDGLSCRTEDDGSIRCGPPPEPCIGP
ncbi:MAG: hypothetical protein H6723_13745, partial [Sandaracinus sp.]|nr:hypothetical protein [Sandaracinus sp.]